jgi:uridine monophosphate synthetase
MTPSFFSQLEDRARKLDSLLCVGLDPHPADLPENTAGAARDFCLSLIAATSDLAVAYKPNAAFFEAYGADGWQALAHVIAAVPEGIPVILDAKRGDIASTAEAYAASAFETLKADAMTINPYLGYDAVYPFIKDAAHGVFVLCKTSNSGSVDLQDLPLISEGRPLLLYEKVALLAEEWNEKDNVGLVVGATFPAALRRVRAQAPHVWILAPGVGMQGGDLKQAILAGLRSDGLGLLLPASRAISRAADPHAAALELTQAIRDARKERITDPVETEHLALSATLAEGLLKADCVRFGNFTLKSGIQSPIYIDMRRLTSLPDVLAEVASAYIPVLRRLEFDCLAALPYAAMPIATAISLQSGWPMIYPRKETKAYGTKADIEGIFQPGDQVVVVDDLATTGGSKFEVIEKLKAAGLVVKDVVVLIDRQSGASEALAEAGYKLHAVVTLTELLDYWESTERISAVQIAAVRKFLQKQ